MSRSGTSEILRLVPNLPKSEIVTHWFPLIKSLIRDAFSFGFVHPVLSQKASFDTLTAKSHPRTTYYK
jgi:hypothetical protein